MNPRAIVFALVVLAAVIAGVVLFEQGERPALEGRVRGVTVYGTTANDSVALLDVQLRNPAKALFEVAGFEAQADEAAGTAIAAVDAARLLAAYPELAAAGAAEFFKTGDRLAPGAAARRAVMIEFAGVPAAKLLARKSLVLRIQEQAGAVVTITESK